MTTTTTRRAVLAGAAAIAVPSATLPASASNADEGLLLDLGRQFDRAADRHIRASRENNARHDAAVNATPKPATLLYTEADAAIGLPKPTCDWLDDPGFTSIDFPALQAIDHPRAREIVAEYGVWAARHKQAVDASGYLDDHPVEVDAYDEAERLHDRISAIPATTIAGLQVKARAAYWACFGDVRDENKDLSDFAAFAILRDLLQPQGLAGMSDHEFFKSNPFAKLAVQA